MRPLLAVEIADCGAGDERLGKARAAPREARGCVLVQRFISGEVLANARTGVARLPGSTTPARSLRGGPADGALRLILVAGDGLGWAFRRPHAVYTIGRRRRLPCQRRLAGARLPRDSRRSQRIRLLALDRRGTLQARAAAGDAAYLRTRDRRNHASSAPRRAAARAPRHSARRHRRVSSRGAARARHGDAADQRRAGRSSVAGAARRPGVQTRSPSPSVVDARDGRARAASLAAHVDRPRGNLLRCGDARPGGPRRARRSAASAGRRRSRAARTPAPPPPRARSSTTASHAVVAKRARASSARAHAGGHRPRVRPGVGPPRRRRVEPRVVGAPRRAAPRLRRPAVRTIAAGWRHALAVTASGALARGAPAATALGARRHRRRRRRRRRSRASPRRWCSTWPAAARTRSPRRARAESTRAATLLRPAGARRRRRRPPRAAPAPRASPRSSTRPADHVDAQHRVRRRAVGREGSDRASSPPATVARTAAASAATRRASDDDVPTAVMPGPHVDREAPRRRARAGRRSARVRHRGVWARRWRRRPKNRRAIRSVRSLTPRALVRCLLHASGRDGAPRSRLDGRPPRCPRAAARDRPAARERAASPRPRRDPSAGTRRVCGKAAARRRRVRHPIADGYRPRRRHAPRRGGQLAGEQPVARHRRRGSRRRSRSPSTFFF